MPKVTHVWMPLSQQEAVERIKAESRIRWRKAIKEATNTLYKKYFTKIIKFITNG